MQMHHAAVHPVSPRQQRLPAARPAVITVAGPTLTPPVQHAQWQRTQPHPQRQQQQQPHQACQQHHHGEEVACMARSSHWPIQDLHSVQGSALPALDADQQLTALVTQQHQATATTIGGSGARRRRRGVAPGSRLQLSRIVSTASTSNTHSSSTDSSSSSTTTTTTTTRRRRRSSTTSGSSSSSNQARGRAGLWTLHHARLLASLREQQALPQGAPVLVAVSGGQDSMALLRLLQDLSTQQHWPLQLAVGHCDHRVRPDSGASAAHVRRAAAALGLPLLEAAADRAQGHWSEAAARAWRHEQLQAMARQAGCSFIALGHTATDRAETVLLNLIRGAGPAGLGSMGWTRQQAPAGPDTGSAPLCYVRPMLGFRREDTLEACQLTGTQVYEDATNQDQRYVRNRLRLSVFPALDAINPRAVEHIAAAAELVQQQGSLLSVLQQQTAAAVLVPCSLVPAAHRQGEGEQQDGVQQHQHQQHFTALDVHALGRLHSALQHAHVHAWLQQERDRQQQQQLEATQLHGQQGQTLHGPQPAAGEFVSYAMVQEVLRLLQPRHGTGARTSTLWGSSCVLLQRGLLLLLDRARAQQLRARTLQVQRVAVCEARTPQGLRAGSRGGEAADLGCWLTLAAADPSSPEGRLPYLGDHLRAASACFRV